MELVAKDNIAFSSKLGAFTVMDASALQVVKLFPNKIKCTCPIKKACIHSTLPTEIIIEQTSDVGHLDNSSVCFFYPSFRKLTERRQV